MSKRCSLAVAFRNLLTLTLFAVSSLALQSGALAMTCPSGPEQMAVSIPNPDPAPAPGNFALNIDGLLSYLSSNNITTVKGLIDHFPRVLNTHYTIVQTTGALHQTSLTHPGLLVWGDGRFMMNIGTNPADPRYEVVDVVYLKGNGDWQFDALDFRTSPPTRRGNGECIQCHGTPARPIWGNYLDWPGMFSDNGLGQELLTNAQASRLTQLKNEAAASSRFHKLEIADYLFDQAGTAMHLPEHAYGPGLTISNTEMGAAVGESLHKRAQRSARYTGLREEYLALSYCDTYAGVLASGKKTEIKNLITSLGGTNTGAGGSPHWTDIYRLWGLDPNHEFPLHLKAGVAVGAEDLNWNTGVSRLREVVDQLIMWQLAQESTSVRNLLQGNPASYPMTSCGNPFPTLYQHTQHKIYALHTLRGNARWAARTGNGNSNLGYYDIDYLRIHQAWDYIRGSMCNLLTQTVGTGTIGNPPSNTPPVANFNFTVSGLTANFTDASSDANGTIASRSWNFGDGTTSTATNPAKTYGSAGTRTVTLTVTDNQGATHAVSKSVTVSGGTTNTPPVANFNFAANGLTVAFTDTSTDANGSVATRSWNFGDGTTSTLANPSKTYASAGTRTVTLTVTDNQGASNSVSKSVTVSGGGANTPPVANFSFTTNLLTVAFTDTSTDANGTIASRSWNFGDGTTSTAANPSKTYGSAGTRTVTLTATDNQGASNTVSKSVTVSSTQPPSVQALLKGVPRTGLSGAAGSVQYFTLHVHGAPPTNLTFQSSGGTGDMDMYVKHGSIPTQTDYQCRPYVNGNSEVCNFATVAEGSWYVMLHAYSAFSGVTLSGDFTDNYTTPPPPPPNVPPGGNVPDACATKTPVYDAPLTKGVPECVTGSPGPGFYRHFYIRLAAADAGKTLVVKMGNGVGNANMLVSTDLGLFPHEEHYAARPDIVFGSTGPTNEETVTIANAKAGRDYLITLPAVTEHAGISIVATVQ